MKKLLFLISLFALVISALSAGASENFMRLSEFNGKKIGVRTGTIYGPYIEKNFPNSKILYVDATADRISLVLSGKVDAATCDEPVALAIEAENDKITHSEKFVTFDNAFMLPKTAKNSQLLKELNEFIAKIKSDGTIDNLIEIWKGKDETVKKVLPYENLPATKGVIKIAHNGDSVPFEYIKDNRAAGVEIDVLARFCQAYGYKPEFVLMNFDALIPALKSNKCDIATACITITEERKENVSFTDPVYQTGGVFLYAKPEAEKTFTEFSEFDGKKIAVRTGEIYGPYVEKNFPNAKILYIESAADKVNAVLSGKIDAAAFDEPVALAIEAENDRLICSEKFMTFDNAFMFPKTAKNSQLLKELNEFIEKIKSDGTIDNLIEIWKGKDEAVKKVLPYENLPATKGVIKIAHNVDSVPFDYIKDNRAAGVEIDILARFCEAYGYKPEFIVMNFAAFIPALKSNKCDIATGCITITEERKENVLFTDPIYKTGGVFLYAKPEAEKTFTEFSEFDGKKIAVPTGTIYGPYLEKNFPNTKISYIDTAADILSSILSGKIDAAALDEPVALAIEAENDRLICSEKFMTFDNAFMLQKKAKNSQLLKELNEFIAKINSDGTIDNLLGIWEGKDESVKKVLPYEKLPATKGVIRIAYDADGVPFGYIKDNRAAGAEIDIIARFCEAYGYKPEFIVMNFGAFIPALKSNKADIAVGSITITEERKENVLFTDPVYKTGGVFLYAKQKAEKIFTKFSELAGKKIAVATGTTHPQIAAKFVPTAELLYFNSPIDALNAVKAGKADAACTGTSVLKNMMAEDDSLVPFGEQLTVIETAPMFAKNEKGEKLCGQFSEFAKSCWDNGTIKELENFWLEQKESLRIMKDYSQLPAPNGILSMAVNETVPPFVYVKDNRIVGYDIDFAVRFCKAYGYGLKLVPMEFSGIIPSVMSGKCDFAILTITDERKESVLFSYPNARAGNIFAVRKENNNTNIKSSKRAAKYESLSELAGKKIAVATGTTHPQIAAKFVPTAELLYFNNAIDSLNALKAGKVDAACTGTAILKNMMAEDDSVVPFGEQLTFTEGAPIFAKNENGKKLCGQFSEFAKSCWDNGTIKELENFWLEQKESLRIMKDYSQLPAPNGILKVAVNEAVPPFVYVKDNRIVGYDIDFVVRFCEAYGYGLKFVPMEFSGIIPAVMSGKCDLGIGAITVTDERKESVLFSYPNEKAGNIFAVRKENNNIKSSEETAKYESLSKFDGKKIGVQLGATCAELVPEKFPKSEVLYFNGFSDTLTALKAGKIDAMCCALVSAVYAVNEDTNLEIVEPYLRETYLYSMFTNSERGQKLCKEYSDFLKELRENGVINELSDKWLGADESKKTVEDYTNLPAPNGIIKMAVDTSIVPFVYVKDTKITGHAVDLAVRFCKAKGYGLEISDMSLSAVITSVKTGKCDFTQAMTITKEREENSLFASEPGIKSGNVLLTVKNKTPKTDKSLLAGKKIAVQTGTANVAVAQKFAPLAELQYFESQTDLFTALKTGKVDALCSDILIARFVALTDDSFTMLGEKLADVECSPIFAKTEKGKKLCEQYSEFIKASWENGTIQEIDNIWYGTDESKKVIKDYSKLPAPNGVLKMAADLSVVPFVYVKDNKFIGYEIDCAVRFCEAYGYGLEIMPMSFAAMIPSLQSGKCDFAACSITYTEERAEQVLFAYPNVKSGIAFYVRKSDTNTAVTDTSEAEKDTEPSFIDELKASFERTFIREDRWKIFVEGIINTLIITVLSIIFGTILGFIVYLACRDGNLVANFVTHFFIWLIKGMPMVVLLMILYYIIFGKVDINGMWVAVIAFTLTFGSGVYGMILSGVKAIDKGQLEGAYALGFSDRRAFFTIILPQAALHFMPAYKSEVVALIKATAIVGYIAVQDLTKMGDIVRSRTYEAFFPLIAVAVIYFILAGILNAIVGVIHNRIKPEKRTKNDILKGIEIHD